MIKWHSVKATVVMKIAVLGATGPSGKELVQEALERGHDVLVLVRNPDKLDIEHEKLRRHSVKATVVMKIALLGATGASGKEFVQEALERGHDVLALVQNPDKLDIKHEKLKIEKVNIFDENELAQRLKGCDAVASCLGVQKTFWTEITFYQDSMKSIVAAMRKSEIKRITCITSWCTVRQRNSLKLVEWFLRPFRIGTILKSMAVMETYLQNECSDIEYTVVRPPMLVNGPSKGETISTKEAQFVEVRSSMPKTPRRDVVKFMLDCLEKDEWKQKFVAIAI